MEIALVLLGTIIGALFHSVIQGVTRKMKTKQEIEDEIDYQKKRHNYMAVEALEWVLNNKNK